MSEDLEKRAPVQGYSAGIPWSMHLRAYDAYCKMYRPQPALIKGGCRGGFGTGELDMFIPGWREELSEIARLREKLAAVEGERDAARQALEHDRAKVITACNQFNDAFARRSWLLDSRGPYEWDDDRYRDEFRGAYDELAAPMVTLTAIGKDWSNCPTNHDEIMRSRQDHRARAEAAEARATAAEAREAELGRALVKYGDRTRMSNCSDQTMQMAIDGAFARAALTKEPGE